MAKIELQLFDADPFVLLAGAILHRAILDMNRGDSWRGNNKHDSTGTDAADFLKSEPARDLAESLGADTRWIERLVRE
jgi:hypothetical protein